MPYNATYEAGVSGPSTPSTLTLPRSQRGGFGGGL